MIRRELGRTGLRVSAIAFGAGPVSGLMTGDDLALQRATVERAIECGVNWFDTAAGYGEGRSETNLGRVLTELGAADCVHIATKVRLPSDLNEPAADYVRRSVQESLRRLRVPRVTLLQLHNGLTTGRGDEPASIAPADVLGPGGVVEAFRELRARGLVQFVGLTGTGHPEAMREVIRSGEFDTLQVPFNVLNPSAGGGWSDSRTESPFAPRKDVLSRSERRQTLSQPGDPPVPVETDYGNVMADCAEMGMGVFAIRVFAGGAMLDQPPSAHTLKTPYFPLALYERDLERARRLRTQLAGRIDLPELAVRFALSHPAVSSAIIGFGSPHHVDEVTSLPLDQPLPPDLAALIPPSA